MPPLMSTECLRELGLAPLLRFSRVDTVRERGGVLANTLGNRPGASLVFGGDFSGLSEPEPLEGGLSSLSTFSALSADEGFFFALGSLSAFILDEGFFGSLVGVAVHAFQEDEPSRLTLGRSFLPERTAAGLINGGGGGASGTAGGGGGGGATSMTSAMDAAFLDFLLRFGGDMSMTWTISSSSPGSPSLIGKLPGRPTSGGGGGTE